MYLLSKFGSPIQNKGFQRPKCTSKAAKLMNIKIIHEIEIKYLERINETCIKIFFGIFQFYGLWGMFCPLKSLILNQGSKFGQKNTLEYFTWWFESILYNNLLIASIRPLKIQYCIFTYREGHSHCAMLILKSANAKEW